MKSTFIKAVIISCVIIGLIVGVFMLTSIKPSFAVRSKLFFDGHPIAAIVAKVKYNAFQQRFDEDELNKMNAKIYEITGVWADFSGTGNSIHNFIVKKNGCFYSADYWGEF